MKEMQGKLALEDGTIYEGRAFGSAGESSGEVVFNTSLTGYQEILTDPSYQGQIVTMTYPLIGNYGITEEDQESSQPAVKGFIVRELTRIPSNYRSQMTLETYLAQNNLIGLEGIDTRALVRRIRTRGAMMGLLSTEGMPDQVLVEKARALKGMTGRDLVCEVTPKNSSSWRNEGLNSLAEQMLKEQAAGPHVVAIDFGMKWNIARCLTRVGCRLTIVPATMTAAEILNLKPDGIFLSNGPGDPAAVGYGIQTIVDLIGKKPIFGICLGHQLLGLAFGAKTFKLKFGHRGSNQPVLNQITGKVEVTTQNHGFAVDPASLPSTVMPTHINLNDNTLEGMRHRSLPIFSVQYHPESSAGPHDSTYLFEEFRNMIS